MAKPSTHSTSPEVLAFTTTDHQQRKIDRLHEGRALTPELRFFRRASATSTTVNAWRDTLDTLESKNLSRGRASVYGGLVMTYVGDQDMKRMFTKHRQFELLEPGNRNRLASYMGSLAADYKSMVLRNESKVIDMQNLQLQSRINGSEPFTKAELPLFMRDIDLLGLWGYIDAGVLPDLEGFGNTKLGVVLRDNPVIDEEIEDTRLFLRMHRFDTDLMVNKGVPHVSIYTAHYPLGSVRLDTVDMPTTLSFDPPQAYVNRNTGPITR
jgi:hypothetical protein